MLSTKNAIQLPLEKDHSMYIGRHSFCFYKPVKIGPFTLSCWRSDEYSDYEPSYGIQVYENGRLVRLENDTRFRCVPVSTQECSFSELMSVIEECVEMFPQCGMVVLEYC
eukprot:TRINITY_DN556_c0_g1_i1.p1 TRINITY_DN556_c0_g1~~TRINITY_DN556_c0_g1_i1.p1  ORF type:complete len:110 (-),score=8.79 TRINITY_DN556_c0_g1_i1:69-398(-)